MLHGLLPELWGLIFALLPHRDLLQFLLVDKAFSAEVRRDQHWTRRLPGQWANLEFFSWLVTISGSSYSHVCTRELAYYCTRLSLGMSIEYAFPEFIPFYYPGYVEYRTSITKDDTCYTICESSMSSGITIRFPADRPEYSNIFSAKQLRDFIKNFLGTTRGYPEEIFARPAVPKDEY